MFGSTILEVAIGMVFVYLLLSLICSAVGEFIEALLQRRSKDLKKGITTLLNDPGLVGQLYGHPLVQALGKTPSYIPSRTFSLALWNIATSAGQAGATAAAVTRDLRQIRTTVAALPQKDVRQALLTLIDEAGNDLDRARENVERWYDDVMDRVSGWYKRRMQWLLLVIGLVVAGLLNVDSLSIVRSLSQDAALRDSLVAAAEGYASTPPAEGVNPEEKIQNNLQRIRSLGLPIGWDPTPGSPRALPGDPGGLFFKLLGLLVTAFAVSLGAPLWFDLLNKFMVVRSTVKPREKSRETPSKDKRSTGGDEEDGEDRRDN